MMNDDRRTNANGETEGGKASNSRIGFMSIKFIEIP